jgi:hypothetical protein
MKRTPLKRGRLPSAVDLLDPARVAWKSPVWGPCAACGRYGLLLRHHVVLEQHVRREGGNPWDLRNALALGYYACSCHRDHHHAVRRIPIARVPAPAVTFASELLGEPRATDYLRRYYS